MHGTRYTRIALVLLLLAALLSPIVAVGCGESQAQATYNKAESLQEDGMLTRAAAKYEEAAVLFLKEKDRGDAARARGKAQSTQFIQYSYSDSKAELEKKLAEMYPGVPEAEREKWITSGEVEHMTWDGKVHYFNQAADNIATRHFDVAYMNTAKTESIAALIRNITSTCSTASAPWQPYSNPNTWIGTEMISVPRSELPEKGLAKIWFPLPLVTGPQNPVTVTSVTPEAWLKQPPSINGTLSDAYFEVPLDQLTGDLDITVQFQFTHYQVNYTIDPANVGTYDKTSDLYRQYTRSYGNTYISADIRAKAKKVVGKEKNPYLAAKKLYDYILKEIKYSYMPHMAMWPRGERESVYVHKMKRGDCGAQSMYFSALCRSLGIPARTTGGWQLFTGDFAGHFWAEFFLPNYGWIPVDPTAADIADWTDKITEQERAEFKEFYFGNQDPLRCNVQLDVDVPTVPPMDGEPMITLAIQDPTGTCSTMEEPLSIVIVQHSSKSAQLVSGQGAATEGSLHGTE